MKRTAYQVTMYQYELRTETHYLYNTLEELADGLRCIALVPHLAKVLRVDIIEW